MTIAGALLMILTGLAFLSFGLFLFYAWLPLLYALVGFDIGLLAGRWLTGDVGTTAIVLGIIGALGLGLASYFLEPYRRILLGVSSGVLVGLAVASGFNLESFFGVVLARLLVVFCGILGGILVLRFFDAFVVGASSLSGATLTVAGAHHLLPNAGLFDLQAGGALPTLIVAALTIAGIIWQAKNIAAWSVLPRGARGPTG